MAKTIREGSAPNFCPPVEEGQVFSLEDEHGDPISLEFLGLILDGDVRFGFFFPVDEDNPALSSGNIVCLEVVELDEEGQPAAFELVEDEAVANDAYTQFMKATKDLYRFE